IGTAVTLGSLATRLSISFSVCGEIGPTTPTPILTSARARVAPTRARANVREMNVLLSIWAPVTLKRGAQELSRIARLIQLEPGSLSSELHANLHAGSGLSIGTKSRIV